MVNFNGKVGVFWLCTKPLEEKHSNTLNCVFISQISVLGLCIMDDDDDDCYNSLYIVGNMKASIFFSERDVRRRSESDKASKRTCGECF